MKTSGPVVLVAHPSPRTLTLARSLDEPSVAWRFLPVGEDILSLTNAIRTSTPLTCAVKERSTVTPVTEESDTASVATETDLQTREICTTVVVARPPNKKRQRQRRKESPAKEAKVARVLARPVTARVQARPITTVIQAQVVAKARRTVQAESTVLHVPQTLFSPISDFGGAEVAATEVAAPMAMSQKLDPASTLAAPVSVEQKVRALIGDFVRTEIEDATPSAVSALAQELQAFQAQMHTCMTSFVLEEAAWEAIEHASSTTAAAFESYGLEGNPERAAEMAAVLAESAEPPSWDELSPHLRAIHILSDLSGRFAASTAEEDDDDHDDYDL